MGNVGPVPAPTFPIKSSVLLAVLTGFDGFQLFSDISDVDVGCRRCRRRRRRRRRRHATSLQELIINLEQALLRPCSRLIINYCSLLDAGVTVAAVIDYTNVAAQTRLKPGLCCSLDPRLRHRSQDLRVARSCSLFLSCGFVGVHPRQTADGRTQASVRLPLGRGDTSDVVR